MLPVPPSREGRFREYAEIKDRRSARRIDGSTCRREFLFKLHARNAEHASNTIALDAIFSSSTLLLLLTLNVSPCSPKEQCMSTLVTRRFHQTRGCCDACQPV